MKKPAIAYLFLLIATTLVCTLKPIYGVWDEVAYMSLVRQDHNAAAAYAELQRSIPSKEYEGLIGMGSVPASAPNDDGSVYMQDMATHPDHFMQQMPLYKVKPLFLAATWVLWKFGLPLFTALHTVSSLSFFMTGLIVWQWLSKYIFGWAAFLVASTVILQPFLLQTARAPLPDALGIALLVAGAYFVREQKRDLLGAGLLLLSILARPDNLIFCVLFFILQWMLIPLVGAVAIHFAVNHFTHGWSWAKLFYHPFVHWLLTPQSTVVHVGPRLYLGILVKNTFNITMHTQLFLFVVLGIWLILGYRTQRTFVCLCLGTIFLHQMAFPIGDNINANRFFAPEYLLILLVAASVILGENLWSQTERKQESSKVSKDSTQGTPPDTTIEGSCAF